MSSSSAPAVIDAEDADIPVGFEDDGDENDYQLTPRVSINHRENAFVNDLTGEEYGNEIEVVVLGRLLQRVLWKSSKIEEGHQPECRSKDGKYGVPVVEEFPWKAVPEEFKASLTDGKLKCGECALREFGSHPAVDNKPWCSLQHVLPVVLPTGSIGLMTFQRSGLAAAKRYGDVFKVEKTPMFVKSTIITLSSNKSGDTVYSTPKFRRGAPTDPAEHDRYTEAFYRVRDFLHATRSNEQPAMVEGGEALNELAAKLGATELVDFGESPF